MDKLEFATNLGGFLFYLGDPQKASGHIAIFARKEETLRGDRHQRQFTQMLTYSNVPLCLFLLNLMF